VVEQYDSDYLNSRHAMVIRAGDYATQNKKGGL